jgi:hypothetical protein
MERTGFENVSDDDLLYVMREVDPMNGGALIEMLRRFPEFADDLQKEIQAEINREVIATINAGLDGRVAVRGQDLSDDLIRAIGESRMDPKHD